MSETANLNIRIDATDADQAAKKLDNLTQSGIEAEAQTRKLGNAAAALNVAHGNLAGVGTRTAGALHATGAAAKLTANEALNLSRQFADVGVTLAMGMNPLMVLLQQGPQIADIMKTSGVGVRGLFTELGLMLGVLQTVTAANDNMAVSAMGAAAAEAELAAATAAASRGAAGAAAGAAQVSAANVAMGETASAAAAAETVALAPLGVLLAGIAAAAIAVGSAFSIGFVNAKDQIGDVGKEMKLTQDQLDYLEKKGVSTTVTMGDAFRGFFGYLKDKLVEAFGPQIAWVQNKFAELWKAISHGAAVAFDFVIDTAVGSARAIGAAWNSLPSVFAHIGTAIANAFLASIEFMINKTIKGMNALIGFVNATVTAVGLKANLQTIGDVSFGRYKDANAGAFGQAGADIGAAYRSGQGTGARARGDIQARIQGASEDRISGALDGYKAKGGGKGSKSSRSAANDDLDDLTIYADIHKAVQQYNEDLDKQMAIGQKFADQIDYENMLRGQNVKQQQVSIALHALETAGLKEGTLAYDMYADKIIAAAEARGQEKLDVQNARDYADAMATVAESVQNATRDFGELFGTAGQGFANLANEFAGYAEQQASLNAQMQEANAKGVEGAAERADITRRMADAEMDHYGNILSASKSFFNEKSKGYRALQAIERAYRLYQAASAVIESINTARSIAMDGAKTASSVANSATRASADGVAAFAKTLASLPFPLNLVAGAAVLAALVAVGVKIAGGGHKASAAASSADTRPDLTSDAQTSPYSTLPGAGGLYEPKNASLAAPKSNVVYPQFGNGGNTVNYNIHAPGADAGTVDTIRNILDAHQQQTIDLAREAAAQDQYMNLTRQRIGGGA